MKQVDLRNPFPIFGLRGLFTETFCHVPVVWKGPDVCSPAHATGGVKNILVFDGRIKCAMPAHAQTCYGRLFLSLLVL